ncbi:MAG: hypothetical protein ACPGWR_19925 [Ardenticatenaceae bacterium]
MKTPPSVTMTVNIDPNTARRRVTGWLISYVGNMIMGGTAQLVIINRALWRVPALLMSSKIGTVGQVGFVDVDAVTGELLVDDHLIEEILNNAQNLVHPTYPSIG